MAHVSTRRSQDATLDQAKARGDHWTQRDLDLVHDLDGQVPDETIALVLGRTLYAVWSVKATISERREREASRSRAPEIAFDRGFVSIDAWERSFD